MINVNLIKCLSGLVVLFAFTAHAQQRTLSINGDVPETFISWVEGMRIESVSLENKTLLTVFSDEKISDIMAMTVADGVCEARYNGNPKMSDDALNKLVVVNHRKMQGFQFSIDANDCDRMGKMSGDEPRNFIKSRMTTYP